MAARDWIGISKCKQVFYRYIDFISKKGKQMVEVLDSDSAVMFRTQVRSLCFYDPGIKPTTSSIAVAAVVMRHNIL